jgi:hypothetical protein
MPPHPASSVQDIAALINIGLTIVGIIFVVLQLRQIRVSIQATSHSAIYEHGVAFREQLIKYPQFRRYFFDGAAVEPGLPEMDRLKTIAEAHLNYMEHLFLVQDGLGRENRKSVDNFLRNALRQSPITLEVLQQRTCAYSEPFRCHLDILLAETDGCASV